METSKTFAFFGGGNREGVELTSMSSGCVGGFNICEIDPCRYLYRNLDFSGSVILQDFLQFACWNVSGWSRISIDGQLLERGVERNDMRYRVLKVFKPHVV